ncbi:hypothetical protein BTE48_00155 [Oceanospirillum multiglobuliferum]|uniref:HTH marR-type domain-containing protein n=2 Tax=Oceanospirillum multiglobuliferum TaxID=64969 RepID=A0A1V4T958_9GAMM|nr:hypothetical protein BTE48_00155 [Oceanospirillum multiglobuliferum]
MLLDCLDKCKTMNERVNASLKLEQFLPYRFNQLAERISCSLSTIYSSEFGISISEWRILAMLGQQPTMISTDISQRTKMDKAKVSRAVQRLEKLGYLLREKDIQDHRVSHLSLTDSGVELYNAIVPKALEWEGNFVGTLSAQEYRDLHNLLNKLDQQIKHCYQK